jgi:formylglycine-generating enzyme required for sulfatase activity
MRIPEFPSATLSLAAALVMLLCSGCTGSRMAAELADLGYEWVSVPGGTYMMGDTWEGTNPDAIPAHPVEVPDLDVSRYETTVAQYDWFTDRTGQPRWQPENPNRGKRAISEVVWQEAVDFCAYIGGRLPTEQEWEYLAAGGTDKQKFPGTDDPDEAEDYVRYRLNALAESFAVGTRQPNRFGLFDMGGNVAEWVSAYYEKYPEPGQEPVWHDLDVFDMRLVRGGGFSSELAVTATYWRAGTLQDIRSPSIGFRCVRDR